MFGVCSLINDSCSLILYYRFIHYILNCMLILSNNLAHLKIKILLMQNDDVTQLLLSVETTNLSVFRVCISDMYVYV